MVKPSPWASRARQELTRHRTGAELGKMDPCALHKDSACYGVMTMKFYFFPASKTNGESNTPTMVPCLSLSVNTNSHCWFQLHKQPSFRTVLTSSRQAVVLQGGLLLTFCHLQDIYACLVCTFTGWLKTSEFASLLHASHLKRNDSMQPRFGDHGNSQQELDIYPSFSNPRANISTY